MIDTQAKPVSYIRLLVLVVLIGVISAVITFAFITLVHLGTELVWEETTLSSGLDPRLFTLLVCTLGGLLVGLLVRLFGDHTGIFAEMMLEFGRTGRFEYRTAPGMVVTALVSLIAGASLGPEAPLADACGGIGTWVSDRLKLNDKETRAMGYSGVSGMLAAFITAPLGGAVLGLESAKGGTGETRKEYFWVLFPSLLASAAATVVFVLLSGAFFQTLYRFPDYVPQMNDLFFAVPLGLLGGLMGMLFMTSLRRLQQFFLPMKDRLVLRGLIGGLGMGVIGALLPLTLYSGEVQIVDLMSRAAEIGVVMLTVLSLAKLFATALLLATGWKGGYIFPLMFASVAMGLAVDQLFPNIPVAVTVAATMAGALVAALRAPLFAALFTITLVQKETAAVVAVAVVASALLTALLTLALARQSDTPERVDQETAET
ncbi:MAG TPA: chloride channel protein [Anaerolineales bacterium]|nr:chloride channel protein [Anaerolineales bacterium]